MATNNPFEKLGVKREVDEEEENFKEVKTKTSNVPFGLEGKKKKVRPQESKADDNEGFEEVGKGKKSKKRGGDDEEEGEEAKQNNEEDNDNEKTIKPENPINSDKQKDVNIVLVEVKLQKKYKEKYQTKMLF